MWNLNINNEYNIYLNIKNFTPDGVIVRSTRQPMEAGGEVQDVGARERLVLPPDG